MGYLPNRAQTLLLQAALQPESVAEPYWKQYWKENHAPSPPTPLLKLGSLLHGRARALQLPDIVQTWTRKAFIEANLKSSLRQKALLFFARELRASKIEPLLVLKGAAASLAYPESSPRPMSDVDVLIPRKWAREAMMTLLERGWETRFEHVGKNGGQRSTEYLPFRHSMPFRHRALSTTVDLHWYSLRMSPHSKWDSGFWQRSQELPFFDVPLRILEPTDRLFHTLVHGGEWRSPPGINWVVDAVQILLQEHDKIDGARLYQLAEERKVLPLLTESLSYLQTHFPSLTMPTLQTPMVQASQGDRIEHALKCSALNTKWLGNLPFVFFQYRRTKRRVPSAHPLKRYLRYTKLAAKYNWGAATLLELTIASVSKCKQACLKSMEPTKW
jgi:hypothetical protein